MTSTLPKNFSRPPLTRRPETLSTTRVPAGFIALAALSVFLTAGCGSEPEENVVVEPPSSERTGTAAPAPVSDTEQEVSNDQPPAEDARSFEGGIELPEGDIPAADTDDEAVPNEPSGGIDLPPDVEVPPVDAGADAGAVEIQYASWQKIEEMAKSSGKVTVVDLWSLSCEPCLKEFPNLVELGRSLGDSAEFIAVNLDYDGRRTRPPEYYEDHIRSFLDGVDGGQIKNFVSNSPADDVYAAAEVVSIPAVLVFDAEGNLAKKFVDAGPSAGFTYEEDIEPLVRKLSS